ncbi:MAG: polyribonucleotide nucleotidyltransferase [Bacillota bacterium]|nr:polyribonucleotide nucleotidyltransferase [Bacillota bacterium]HPZ53909.1 polyribonucleotide nucleotidyltransferase [Bacillota bacterium]
MPGEFEIEIGGRTMRFEVGELAQQADGSVLVRYGDTTVLVTAVMSKEPREGIDFFPLLVDYEERQYAVGRIPGGWFKREGRPSEAATLAARMVDRPLRPLFPEGFRNDVQVVATVLSVDTDNEPDIVALNGASAALCISGIPFDGPVAGVRIGRVDGAFVVNPTVEQASNSDMSITVAGTEDAIMMVEAGASEISEKDAVEAIVFAHEEIKRIVAVQREMMAKVGKQRIEVPVFQVDPEIDQAVRAYATDKIDAALRSPDKLERQDRVDAVRNETRQHFEELHGDGFEQHSKTIDMVLDNIEKEIVRQMILNERTRVDGRALDEVRTITCKVGVLPRVHGSGLFQRGQTQVMTVCTLGTIGDEQLLDGLSEEESKRYIHHYNFPPYSVGEVRPIRSPGRREIGHGALAERSLLPVIPDEEVFPYTIRLVSEVLGSNGSTSQASVCGSTLALMDAGVPIRRPVAGVAMGLVKGDGGQIAILTDIQGLEDRLGDMDFKVAGTAEGITAIQMDMKVKGISPEILEQALEQAREARLFILSKMLETIDRPRPELSPYAPRMSTMVVNTDKIRDIIGPGGKTIRKIIDDTGVKIDIQDDGRVYVYASDEEASNKAMSMIADLVRDVEEGEIYEGRVTRIMNFGAFVELLPGKEGLIHISELDWNRVNRVEDVLNIGDQVRVKVIELDGQGRINLSRKALLPRTEARPTDTRGGYGHGKRPSSFRRNDTTRRPDNSYRFKRH